MSQERLIGCSRVPTRTLSWTPAGSRLIAVAIGTSTSWTQTAATSGGCKAHAATATIFGGITTPPGRRCLRWHGPISNRLHSRDMASAVRYRICCTGQPTQRYPRLIRRNAATRKLAGRPQKPTILNSLAGSCRAGKSPLSAASACRVTDSPEQTRRIMRSKASDDTEPNDCLHWQPATAQRVPRDPMCHQILLK